MIFLIVKPTFYIPIVFMFSDLFSRKIFYNKALSLYRKRINDLKR